MATSTPSTPATAPPAAKPRSLGDVLLEFSQHRRLMQEELQKVIVGQDEVIEQIFAAIFTRGHCLLVGVPGLAKTLMVSTLAQDSGHPFQADPVHARPDAVGHHRHERAGGRREGPAGVPLCRGTDLYQHPAGRRNQPHAAQDPGSPAPGHAGARGDRGPEDLPLAGAVLHHRHAEPHRAGRHLPAARGPVGPLHVQHQGRLPVRGRRKSGSWRKPPAARRSRSARSFRARPS